MLSRKEQLALFKQNKLLKATAAASKAPVQNSKPKPGSVRSKVHMSAAKSTVFQSNNRSSARNDRNVVMAGKKKIGSSTPIGKLQARLRAKASVPNDKSTSSDKENTKKCNKNLFGDDDESDECVAVGSTDTSAEIRQKMDEADYLNEKHGCHVARAYMEELPKDESCAHLQLLSKSLYWLTWIEIEKSAHQWERVEKLFLQAESLVRTALDKAVITAAYEKFRQEGDCILESKMDSLNQTIATVPPSLSVSDNSRSNIARTQNINSVTLDKEQEPHLIASVSKNAFQGVNVANTRRNYEESIQRSNHKGVDNASFTGVNVKSLSENLISNMSKSRKANARHLAGGVALPCMLATRDDAKSQEKVSTSSTDELSSLLGIDNEVEIENHSDSGIQGTTRMDNSTDDGLATSSAPPPRKKVCRARAPVRVVHKSDNIFSDSDDDDDDEAVYKEIYCQEVRGDDSPQHQPRGVLPSKLNVAKETVDVTTTSRRVTRSGVCFAEQNYNTPSKKRLLENKKKRKVTPFKPHIDDAILSSEE